MANAFCEHSKCQESNLGAGRTDGQDSLHFQSAQEVFHGSLWVCLSVSIIECVCQGCVCMEAVRIRIFWPKIQLRTYGFWQSLHAAAAGRKGNW